MPPGDTRDETAPVAEVVAFDKDCRRLPTAERSFGVALAKSGAELQLRLDADAMPATLRG